MARDGRTVALGFDPRDGGDVIYIKEFDRPRSERDEYLDHSLRALAEAFETEVSGMRAIVGVTNPRPSVERAQERALEAHRFHH